MPDYCAENVLGAERDPAPALTTVGSTSMRCVASCVADIEERGWAHHIQRLMVLGNLALLAGVDPRQVTDWMWESFVGGAGWVMVPNVVGRALYADGGRISTKPCAAGGAYIDRMSDYCMGCAYDRKQRVAPLHALSPRSTRTSCCGTRIALPAPRESLFDCAPRSN